MSTNKIGKVKLASQTQVYSNFIGSILVMKSPEIKVTLNIEIDEGIYQCMQDFFDSNPHWNSETIFNASLSLFLMQNYQDIESEQYQACGQRYLNSIYGLPFQK